MEALLTGYDAGSLCIREEIDRVVDGTWPLTDSPPRNAPHTAADLLNDKWELLYTREQAAYPPTVARDGKYWPPVSRIDGAAGDRDLICSCPAPTAYAQAPTAPESAS